MKAKLFLKQAWLWAKKFWWAIIIVLLLIGAGLVSALMRNGVLLARVMDLLQAKRDQHDQEMETLSHIHNTEIDEKNRRLEQHLQEKDDIQRKFEEKADKLDKTKEEELKKLVDESYNDPEKLAKEIADAFGLENG
jgi:flagellar biosynthesis/type III secretory pathway M-ring protein FliF/YscJ